MTSALSIAAAIQPSGKKVTMFMTNGAIKFALPNVAQARFTIRDDRALRIALTARL